MEGKMKPQRWFVFTDPHIPNQDRKTMAAIEAYLADHKWDGWLCLGDFMDFNEISRWVANTPRKKRFKLKQCFEEGKALLERHSKILRKKNPNCRMVLLAGNHDDRIEQWLDQYPEFEGLLEVEKLLELKEKKVEYVDTWRKGTLFKLGHAHFTHGKYTNVYHARKMAQTYGTCIYYGHTHDIQEISVEFMGNDKTIVGKSLGCTCEYDQEYLRGAPTKWQQSFAVFHFFPDGFYTENTTRIFKHRFYAEEKIYDGIALSK